MQSTAQLGNKKEGDYAIDHCRVFSKNGGSAKSYDGNKFYCHSGITYFHVKGFAPNSTGFNPLSPNSDQQQFSPNDIHTLS